MTAQEMVDKLNRETLDEFRRGGKLRSVFGAGGEVIEAVQLKGAALLALYELGGAYRVVMVEWYVNRAGRPQANVYLKEHDGLDEAETLFLEVMDMNGFLAFGDLFKVSLGSGVRFVRNLD